MSDPEGWYPDPNNQNRIAFWTGSAWDEIRVWNGSEWVLADGGADTTPRAAQDSEVSSSEPEVPPNPVVIPPSTDEQVPVGATVPPPSSELASVEAPESPETATPAGPDPEGWYPDPKNQNRIAFWTGSAWDEIRVWNGSEWVLADGGAYERATSNEALVPLPDEGSPIVPTPAVSPVSPPSPPSPPSPLSMHESLGAPSSYPVDSVPSNSTQATQSVWKRPLVLTAAALIVLAAAGGILLFGGSSSSAQATAAKAIADLQTGRWTALCQLEVPSQQSSCRSRVQSSLESIGSFPRVKIASVVASGNGATVTVTCSGALYCADFRGLNSTQDLVRLNGTWYLSNNVIPSTSTSSTTTTTTTTIAVTSAAAEAASLTNLLETNAQDRPLLQSSISVIQASVGGGAGCGPGVQTAVTNLQQVVRSRQRSLNELSILPMSLVPSGLLVRGELTSAWTISERIDADFEHWGIIETSGNCRISDSRVSTYVATETLDPRSTSLKNTFVALWDPIAAQFNQPSSWTADQI